MKLLQLGVGTNIYSIFKSMYNNSQSCVRLKNGLTNHFKSGIGVRQGDGLSQNLFKIFINDLPDIFFFLVLIQLSYKRSICIA